LNIRSGKRAAAEYSPDLSADHYSANGNNQQRVSPIRFHAVTFLLSKTHHIRSQLAQLRYEGKPTTTHVLTVAMVTPASIRRQCTAVISDCNTASASTATAAAAAAAVVASDAQIQVLNMVES